MKKKTREKAGKGAGWRGRGENPPVHTRIQGVKINRWCHKERKTGQEPREKKRLKRAQLLGGLIVKKNEKVVLGLREAGKTRVKSARIEEAKKHKAKKSKKNKRREKRNKKHLENTFHAFFLGGGRA